MSIIIAAKHLVLPFILWRAKRRSKRDNTFTLEQLEELTAKLKSRKS
jgi:hypothetical protein